MTEPTNLNRARKIRAKAEAKAKAAANRIAFGRTKAERSKTAAEAALSVSRLDGKKREP